jgi:glycosyltransferase involved in cell wall biosynthesis
MVTSNMHTYGGAEHLIVTLANHMTRNGIENALLTTSIRPEIEKDLTGTKVIIRGKLPTAFGEAIALNMGIIANSKNYDVINIHNYPTELAIGMCNKPVVWMCNEPAAYLLRQTSTSLGSNIKYGLILNVGRRLVRRHVDRAVVADEFNAERFRSIYGIDPDIINYGIDSAFFSDKRLAKPRPDFSGRFVVLQVGGLQQFKNQIASLRTVNVLKERIPNVLLVLAGGCGVGDPYKSRLEEYIHENRLEKYVTFTGHVSRKEIRDLYYVCDVLLHPIKAQGGWLSPFEALCAEKPIVVSEEMTCSSIIRDKGIGTVTGDYVKAILDIYDSPTKYLGMARKGRVFVQSSLSWDKFCNGMVSVFEKAIKGESAPRI